MKRNFAVFILTHGRADKVITYHTLRRSGYSGKIYLILDDEDTQKDRYKEIYSENEIIVFSKEEAAKYNCSLRSIQRDIDDLRAFFSDRNLETGMNQELIYDRVLNGYRLEPSIRALLTDEETFAVIKILLESRALTKKELKPILKINCTAP